MQSEEKKNSLAHSVDKGRAAKSAGESRTAKLFDELLPDTGSSSGRQTFKCSLCGVPFVREQSKVFPFCSPRCQLIDLGGWFNEKFGLPVEGHEDHPAPAPDEEWE